MITKKRFRHTLPFGARRFARQLIVQVVGWVVRLIGDILNIAASNGLDLKRAIPSEVRAGLAADPIEVAVVVEETPPPPDTAAQPLGVEDFLFLMEAISRQRNQNDSSDIRASIVIPVFNKLDYTFQCIRSLFEEIDFNENEVIVINNASSDQTARVLSHMQGLIRVVNNEENQGFILACNEGARLARGKYVVFLNNDTIVQPGWLQHLIETVESDPQIGAVGSMLVYPDGRLQEAGSIIWMDGTGWNYGKFQNPEDKRFTFMREVDYCSGASLLVRKDLFDRLGGFDVRFNPAYYEDVDICTALRFYGFKVIYQPLSRLIHYEGITAGTDVKTGFKRYQQINHVKFVRKWEKFLQQEHLEYDAEVVELAANRRRGPRLLVFDNMVPTPDRDAGSMRMSMILKSLAKWAQPVFVPFHKSSPPEYERQLEKEGVEIVAFDDYRKLVERGDFFAAILSRAAIADKVLPVIRKIDNTMKIVFDTVDIHFLRLEREFKLTGDETTAQEARQLREMETRLAAASDQVWCVTPADKEVLEKESRKSKVAPIVIIPTIHPPQSRGKTFEQREGILFIGGFLHTPNTDAVHYFLQDILPRVREKLPHVNFYIVGSNVPEAIMAYDSADVIVRGYVPDVAPLFNQCRVFVAPLRYGAGMKGKVGQALSFGLPVVTTSIGAEGMGLKDAEEVLISDGGAEFAEKVVEVYSDPELWQRLSDNGYRHIAENFSPQVVDGKLRTVIKGLCKQGKSER